MSNELPEIGLSTLKGRKAVLVGYGFDIHPEREGWSIVLSIYQLDGRAEYVLCLSQLGEGNERERRRLLAHALDRGLPLYADHLIPYAQRHAAGPLSEFKQALAEAYPAIKWRWREC